MLPASALSVAPPGRVAQLAEHSTLNRQVVGSIPTASTMLAYTPPIPASPVVNLGFPMRWLVVELAGLLFAPGEARRDSSAF